MFEEDNGADATTTTDASTASEKTITPDGTDVPAVVSEWYAAGNGDALYKCSATVADTSAQIPEQLATLKALEKELQAVLGSSQSIDSEPFKKYVSETLLPANSSPDEAQRYADVSKVLSSNNNIINAPVASSIPEEGVEQFSNFQTTWDTNAALGSTATADLELLKTYESVLTDLIDEDGWNQKLSKFLGVDQGAQMREGWLGEMNAAIAALKASTATIAGKDGAACLKDKKAELHAVIDDAIAYIQDNKCTDANNDDIFTEDECGPIAWHALEQLKKAKAGDIALVQGTVSSQHFREQCFLLANILEFARYKKFKLESASGGLVTKRLPYVDNGNNACLMIDGESYGFINQLTQSPTQNVFFDMEPKDIATLQPMIRLYKVNTDKESGAETEIEMNFSSNATDKEIKKAFDDSGRRGVGVGIKEFNFTYDGSTPFAAKKSIKAKLTLVANNFDELLKPRGRSPNKYRYIDLALKTGTKTGAKTELQEANLSKLNFRLKALVGWALPPGELEHFGGWKKPNGKVIKKTELITAIYDSFVTLNLTPTIHEFGIDETGRTTLTINYLAYVDDFYDQPTFNIFSDQNAALTLLTRDLRYKKVMQSPNCNAADIAEMKKEEG